MRRSPLRSAAVVCIAAAAMTGAPAFAALVSDWTFETTQPATSGPFAAETGNGSASGFHAGSSTYSSPAGNGSSHSFSSNTWAVGDYYQFQLSTVGFSGLTLSWDQTSSGTGPGSFLLEYSTNGTTFTAFGSAYTVAVNGTPNPPWNATTASPIYTMTRDLGGITALNNQANVYFRLLDSSTTAANPGTVAAGGTDRVDNFVVATAPSAVPLPGAAWLLGSGVLALVGTGRRRSRRLANG